MVTVRARVNVQRNILAKGRREEKRNSKRWKKAISLCDRGRVTEAARNPRNTLIEAQHGSSSLPTGSGMKKKKNAGALLEDTHVLKPSDLLIVFSTPDISFLSTFYSSNICF
jgi:hypothetical protein